MEKSRIGSGGRKKFESPFIVEVIWFEENSIDSAHCHFDSHPVYFHERYGVCGR